MISEPAIQQPVLHGFGDVLFLDLGNAFQIGDGSGHAADFVEGAGA